MSGMFFETQCTLMTINDLEIQKAGLVILRHFMLRRIL